MSVAVEHVAGGHIGDAHDGIVGSFPGVVAAELLGEGSQLASLSSDYGPLFFASAVLADGKVIVEGGEQNFSQAGGLFKRPASS